MKTGRPAKRAASLVLVVLAALAAVGYWWFTSGPSGDERDFYSGGSGLYPIQVGEKHGYMDRAGKIVITPHFDEAGLFREGLAPVRSAQAWGYVDVMGRLVIPPQFDAAQNFNDGLAPVKVGAKWGYVGPDGKVSIVPQFDQAGTFVDGVAAVRLCCGDAYDSAGRRAGSSSEHRYAVIDHRGQSLTTGEVYFISQMLWAGAGVVVARLGGDTFALIDSDGTRTPLAGVTEVADAGMSDGLAGAASNGKWGFVDRRGGWSIQPQFDEVGFFNEGHAAVKVSGRWGLVDRSGRFVVNPQFDAVLGYSEGLVAASQAGRWGHVDLTGKVAIPFQFSFAGRFSRGLANAYVYNDRRDFRQFWISPAGQYVGLSPESK